MIYMTLWRLAHYIDQCTGRRVYYSISGVITVLWRNKQSRDQATYRMTWSSFVPRNDTVQWYSYSSKNNIFRRGTRSIFKQLCGRSLCLSLYGMDIFIITYCLQLLSTRVLVCVKISDALGPLMEKP
jgi:hypothetical protein